jgi:PilZ domain
VGDRRYERRVPKADHLVLLWCDAQGARQSMSARLFDLSPSGACLIVEKPVRVLSMVEFTHEGRHLTASVRYSKRSAEGFMIGVEFLAPATLT